jgi:Sin3 associated polypeptide p18 (SAP18)
LGFGAGSHCIAGQKGNALLKNRRPRHGHRNHDTSWSTYRFPRKGKMNRLANYSCMYKSLMRCPQTTPFLIRTFIKIGSFHRLTLFEDGTLPTTDEQQIFTWCVPCRFMAWSSHSNWIRGFICVIQERRNPPRASDQPSRHRSTNSRIPSSTRSILIPCNLC